MYTLSIDFQIRTSRQTHLSLLALNNAYPRQSLDAELSIINANSTARKAEQKRPREALFE
jgi:hypothetical protein